MNKQNYTLVIQGKLHENTIQMCNLHKDMKTIVSTWNSEIPAKKFLESAERPNLTILSNPLPDLENVNNNANRFYQFQSTYYGIDAVTTKYAIKVRTDEYYSNLDPIIKASVNSPEKLITNDVFFRKTSAYAYHPSDHLIVGKTEYLKKVFNECIRTCKNTNFPGVPEQQIGMHFIILKENLNYTFLDLPKDAESHDVITTLMAKHFDIISTNELGDFFVTTNCLKKTWQDTGYIDKRYDAYTSHNLAKEL